MALDPREEIRASGLTGEAALRRELTEVKKALADLKRSSNVFVTSGAPTIQARAGAFAVDPVAHRLWVSEGGGNWKSVVVA